MNDRFYAFGEILWDCLPSGRHAGGAPFNVAAHLAQLGVPASLISAIGRDALGDEITQVARDKGVDVTFIAQARAGLATGTVQVTLDAHSNATYEIVQPVAWDEIPVPDQAVAAVAQGGALVYGSLAGRSPANLEQLDRLLRLSGPMKLFDVNLRPPFADLARVLQLARRADVIKLNDDEAGLLAAYARAGKIAPEPPRDEAAIARACAVIADATGAGRVCVTRGAAGAALWEAGRLTVAPAPQVEVRDTVGAGDAFMAGLAVGLTRGGGGGDSRALLERACRLGAFVASHYGATPLFPSELITEFREA